MKYYKIILLFFILLSFQSCIEGVKGLQSWIDASNIEEVKGEYHFLSEDGIKVFLPSVFKKHTTEEYKGIIKKLLPSKDFKLEDKRLELLKKMDGNFSVFYDKETQSTFTVNSLPYQPIYKKDAQYLLGMIRMNYENNNKDPDIEYTKVTAKYNADRGPQIFKAVFKIENTSTKIVSYIFTYVISANEKTAWIQLQSPYENGVDDYLNKLVM
ncbi:hypothetical protein [Lacinutrix jangbogonensis]|uniref:hypothetical protein n=1 Tax=Lacinutrix jangbogonensis TaxID=1469557 RepID=UPI00053F13FB|nr:hypothetical protein [Lacinutrix jangbogonensis]